MRTVQRFSVDGNMVAISEVTEIGIQEYTIGEVAIFSGSVVDSRVDDSITRQGVRSQLIVINLCSDERRLFLLRLTIAGK